MWVILHRQYILLFKHEDGVLCEPLSGSCHVLAVKSAGHAVGLCPLHPSTVPYLTWKNPLWILSQFVITSIYLLEEWNK